MRFLQDSTADDYHSRKFTVVDNSGHQWTVGEPYQLLVNYTTDNIAAGAKAVHLDNLVMPVVLAAPDMQQALEKMLDFVTLTADPSDPVTQQVIDLANNALDKAKPKT